MPLIEDESLQSIEVEVAPPVKKSVIWLHGLGADGNDFVPLAKELKLSPSFGIRFIFPHAPIMPVTLNNGYEMRAWFDIYDFSRSAKIDRAGIAKSENLVKKLIENEIKKGIACQDIFLAGFSQGAALALTVGLRYPRPLAGIIALSGYLPLAEEVIKTASDAHYELPIFMAHGTHDPLLSIQFAKMIADLLKAANYPLTWHTYAMPHTVCHEEIEDLSKWLIKNK